MHEPLRLSGAYLVNPDRLQGLYATASEVHGSRRPPHDHEGVVERTRVTIGRRLVSIGSSLAGTHA